MKLKFAPVCSPLDTHVCFYIMILFLAIVKNFSFCLKTMDYSQEF